MQQLAKRSQVSFCLVKKKEVKLKCNLKSFTRNNKDSPVTESEAISEPRPWSSGVFTG